MGDSNVISLSVEETNALRAKLGIKPLSVDKDGSVAAPGQSTLLNDTLVTPVVPGERGRTEDLKARLEARQERRAIERKLSSVRTLGQAVELDDTEAWLQRSREKKQATAIAQRLQAQDDESEGAAGLGGSMANQRKRKRQSDYAADALAGLKVAHDEDRFESGGEMVLTLRDASVLEEEEGDVLENIDIVDQERLEDNLEKRKKKAYSGLDEVDDDLAFGGVGKKAGSSKGGTLAKYDDVDVVTGDQARRKVAGFTLGQAGTFDLDGKRKLEEVQRLLQQRPTLSLEVDKTAGADYFTQEEMMQFKKRKRVKKVKRRERGFTADDLLPLEPESAGGGVATAASASAAGRGPASRDAKLIRGTLGSGDGHASVILAAVTGIQGQAGAGTAEEDATLAPRVALGPGRAMEVDQDVVDQDSLLDMPLDADEADEQAQVELQAALERARRAKLKREAVANAAGKVAQQVALRAHALSSATRHDIEGEEDETPVMPGGLVFSSMSEFVRNVGHTVVQDTPEPQPPQPAFAGKVAGAMAVEEAVEEPGAEAEVEAVVGEEAEEENIMESLMELERPVSLGVAAALQVARTKGFMEIAKPEVAGPSNQNRPDDLSGRDRDRDYRDRDRDRRGGDRQASSSYRDRDAYRDRGRDYDPFTLPGYKPQVTLKYQDERGRDLNERDAFRHMSHAFHGKGVGRNKADKLLKRHQEQDNMQRASTADTPLNTLQLQKRKMEVSGSAHIVLDGKGSAAVAKKPRTK